MSNTLKEKNKNKLKRVRNKLREKLKVGKITKEEYWEKIKEIYKKYPEFGIGYSQYKSDKEFKHKFKKQKENLITKELKYD